MSSKKPITPKKILTFNPLSLNTLSPSSQQEHFCLSAYGPKLKVSVTFPPDEGRTKQSFKQECDINHIMARYVKTGIIEFTNKHAPQYGDVTGLDFREGIQVVAAARSMFEEMPSHLRARFYNNPEVFLDFVNNPANREEARKLGLLKREARSATPVPGKEAAPHGAASTASAEGVKGAKGDKPSTPQTI